MNIQRLRSLEYEGLQQPTFEHNSS